MEAQGGDLLVSHIRVTMDRATAAIGQLSSYVKEVGIVADGKKIGSVSASSFTKSGNTYNATVALDNTQDSVVKELVANRKTFYVTISASDSLIGYTGNQPQWTVTVSNVRVQDNLGAIVTTSDWTGDSATRSFDTLATSGVVKLKIAKGANNPLVGNVQVSDTSSTPDILLNEFTLKAEGSDIYVTDITFDIATSTNFTASVASDFQLKRKDGSNWLQIADWTATVTNPVTATLYDELKINKDAIETFRLYSRINQATTTNYAAGASLTASYSNATAEDVTRNTISAGNKQGSASGEAQRFYSEGIIVSGFSSPTPVPTNDQNGKHIQQSYTVNFKVQAFGREFFVPEGLYRASNTSDTGNVSTAGLAIFPTTAGATSTALASVGSLTSLSCTASDCATGNLTDNRWPIQANTYRMFSATIDAASPTFAAGYWRIQLANVRYATSSTAAPTILELAPAQNFRTSEAKID